MEQKETEAEARRRIAQLDFWQSAIEIEPIYGGITNLNYRVTDDRQRYFVRVGDDLPEHRIDRRRERAATRAAAAAGFGPALLFAAPGVLVLDYIEGRTLTATDVGKRSTLQRIVTLLRQYHETIAAHLDEPAPDYWVFDVINHYLRLLQNAAGERVRGLSNLRTAAEQLRAMAPRGGLVVGHNDLLAANLIDDGERIWLVDYEYAGLNSPLFDLGGLASNNGLNEQSERELLALYDQSEPEDTRWHDFQVMKCASLLRETLWSMVSDHYRRLDFDFAHYTQENVERFSRAWDDLRRA